MKHFRILEVKGSNKYYIIQYLKNLVWKLSYWQNLNNKRYKKYEDALGDVKKILKKEDYESKMYGYHYIDAHKIFKTRIDEVKTTKPQKVKNKK